MKACKECGWVVPQELIQNISNGKSIYCERCGSEIKLSIPSINNIEKNQKDFFGLLKDLKDISNGKSIYCERNLVMS
ncbi:MAG: hypothetical protein ACTSRI_01965 [Promethearchaeota archaeon]